MDIKKKYISIKGLIIFGFASAFVANQFFKRFTLFETVVHII
jgi:hypothetical protein